MGASALTLDLFLQTTPAPGEQGGLLNAIAGSLIMVGLAVLLGTPIGIMAGTYLAEFGQGSWLAPVTRFINDILLSAPSIVIPVVARATGDMLRLIPNSLHEAAAALGASQWKIVTLVTWRASRAGILTGILLAIARISGETAPLLFTALNNQFWNTDMNRPMANLPVVIFQFAMSPYEHWQELAWAGALLITLSVLGLNILVRSILRR